MPQPDPFSNAFAPMPSGLWGDEYRAAGGVTFDDVFRWQEEQAAEQARLQALAEEEWRTEQAAAGERARQQQYAQASEQFIDWPTYQQRAGGNPAETYASYVQQVLPAQLAAMGYTREEIADELKMFVGMVHQPAPDYGFFGNLGESMSQGARSGTRGVGAAIDIMQGDLDELAQTVVAAAGDQNTTAPLRRFQEVMGAPEGERDWWEATKAGASAVWDTPVGALNFLAQQLSQSYPVLGAGLAAGLAGLPLGGVGGAVTGALGVGTGSTALEAGASIIERITKEAQARGVNLQDPEAVRRMLDTPGLYDELKSAAIAKGLTVGSTDALLAAMSLGLGSLAGKAALAGRGGRAMGYGAAGVASDALGSAGGEWLSQQTAGDTTDWREIVGEAIGELGSAAVTTSAGAGYSLLRGRNPLLPDVLPDQGELPGGEPDIPLLPGPLPVERQLPPPSQVAIILGDASQQAEQTVAETNPLFATLDRVSPGWREHATAEVTEPGTPQIDLDDAAQVRQFIQQELRAAGVNTGGFTRSIQADELIGMVVNAPADSKREAIAEAIDALEPTDLTFAAGMAKALLNLTKTLPAPDAQQIVEAATVQPNRALVDVINQITGVRTRDERLAAEQAWYDHFVATRDEFAAMRQARQQRREQEADAAWERVQLESRVTAMNEQYDRQPVDQAVLDAASQQLDRILERASVRTPTSREKLQKLRLRAQLLLEESVDAYNRGLGERADAGGGGVGVVGRGGPDTGGGGVGYLTAGGRSSTASAITPLQYRYLNERGGRRDVDSSIGARLIAEELGIDNTEVVSTVAQAMAHYVVGFPLTALTPVAEVPYSHPVDLMPGERTQYNADSTQYLEAGTPGSRFRRRDATLDEVTRRERGERAAALVEQRRARRTANALKRPLRPGELIPTADIVAGFRGPVPAGEGGAQAAQGSRRGLRAGVAQARVDQSEAARDAARELAARSGAAIAAEPDAAQSDQGISRVGLGGRYPMQERPATRGTVDTGYSVRNPLKGRTQTEMERDADDRRADRYARTLEARERRAAAKAAAKAEKKGKKQGLSRAMRKEARLESEAMYEELYPDRSYEEDLGEIMDAVEEARSEDSRILDARGLSEDDQVNLLGSTDDVLAYLEKVAATPLQRFIAGQLRNLGLELPPIKFGPIEGGKASGRYEFRRGVLGGMRYQILIDPDRSGLHTILHELVHAATMRLIAEPETVAQKQAVAQLEQLMAYVMQVRPDLAEIAGKPGPGYGLKNLQDFIAVALTDTYFQRQLAEIPVPKHPNFSVLQALRVLILKMFGVSPDTKMSNVLEEVFAAAPQLMSGKQITASGWRALDARANVVQKYLNSGHVFHAVRNDADIASIMQNGLARGSNLSTTRDGQAFEDEGGTILVFRAEDVAPVGKGYQADSTAARAGAKPVAIIKDTSLIARPGRTQAQIDKLLDEWTAKYEQSEQAIERIEKTVGVPPGSLDTAFYRAYGMRRLMSAENVQAEQAKLRATYGEFFDRALELYRESNRLSKEGDRLAGMQPQEPVSPAAALRAYRQYGIPVHALPLGGVSGHADSLAAVPPPAAPIPRAPSTAIIGTNAGGQRSFIAYQKKPGVDEYTLYQTTPQEPRGDPQTKVVRLTREQVERTIRNAGSRVIPPTAGRTNQQPSNTASKLAGWDADGNLRAMAYEQKDGTWTYFESDSDVRTDPRARVVKQLSRAQAQQYIAAQGRRPAPPRGGNTLRAGGAPTPVTYSAANWARLLLQDTEATLKQIGEAQRRAGTPAAQRIDVQATLRNSRVKAKYDKVKRQYIQPAVKAADDVARRFNRTQSEIEEILANLHVTERMPHKIRQVQRGQWSTQQAMQNKLADLNRKERAAQAFLRQLNTTNPQLLRTIKQDLSPKIKAMTDNTVDMMAAYGLIDLQTAQDIKDAYDWYVPLQTGDRTALNRAATGASATSDRPFSRMVEQAYLAIARGEQNALRVEVANLVRQNQLLEQTDGGTRVPLQMGATQRVWFDPVTNTLNEGTDTHVFDDNSIDIYENGQRTRLTIHDPTLLEALHPYKGEQRQTILTYALALWARVTHLIAIGKTSLNPTFPLFNGIRDVLAANINMPPGVSRLRFNMALLSPETWTSALTAIGQDLVGREVTGRIGTAAEEGAFITHRAFLGGVDEISRDIDSMFGPVNLTSPGGLKRGAERARARQKRVASKVFDALSVVAQISETVPRYAVYKAALDSGMSQQEAAFAAKTASINFENRGLINPSNYWIFGNAKLQGLRALYETAQRAGTGKAVFGLLGIVALGAIAGALGVKLSDEDKDGLSKYFKIPDYRKDAMIVWKEGAWGVPIPQEIAPFYVLGNALAEGMAGRRPSEVASRILTASLNNVWMGNVPQQDVLGHRADVIDFAFRAMMPSIAQPMIAYNTNKNTFGSEVVPGMKEKLARGQPRHEMGGPAEDKLAVNVAKGLNTATGGAVDLAPQQLRLFNDFFNPTSELYGVLRDTIVGRDSKYVGDEPNPWTRRFAANATQFADQNQFDELLSKATRAEYLAKEHGISTLSLDDQALARSAATLKKIKSDADNLFKGQKLMTPERRQALNERKLDMYLTGIKRYNDLRDRMVPAR